MSIETYGRYQLVKKLATGGMAQIFLALQEGVEGFRKMVVVKRILPHLAENDDFITMFLDEARIAARLNHPNVVQIFDLGSQDDSYYIAMEYIHGEDVRRVWKQAERVGAPIPVPLICRIIIESCNGLDYAHKKTDQAGRALNIVHRDISPQNILLSFEGHVKIVDFGIAKAADQATVTRSGVLKGKYSYMSPEQAAGQAIDCRTDIFALGVVLYELLTGTRLFKRANDLQTLNTVMECKLDPPSQVNARSPSDLDGIVLRALAKDRDQRYSEARLFAADLEDWLLSHQYSSSTANLAGFMQEIYAERLAQEAEEGRLQVLALDGSRDAADPDRATPGSQRAARSGRSLRGAPISTKSAKSLVPSRAGAGSKSGAGPKGGGDAKTGGGVKSGVGGRSGLSARGAPKPGLAATSADRVSNRGAPEAPKPASRDLEFSLGPGATEASMPTETFRANRPTSRRLVAAGVLVLVAGAVALVAALARSGPQGPATVTVTTLPPGAELRLDGALIPGCLVSPCLLPPIAPGRYQIKASREGYRTAVETHEVPSRGSLAITLVLVPEEPSAVDAGAPAVAAVPTQVMLGLMSEPPGATVSLAGERRGTTPLSLLLPAGSSHRFEVELEGYLPVAEDVAVGREANQAHSFVLRPQKKDPEPLRKIEPPRKVQDPVVRPVKRPPPVDPVRLPEAKPAMGTVRFTVSPWAFVECPPYNFRDTPFGPQQMAVGEYVCTFKNPELGKSVVRTVRVEPGNRTPAVTVVLSED